MTGLFAYWGGGSELAIKHSSQLALTFLPIIKCLLVTGTAVAALFFASALSDAVIWVHCAPGPLVHFPSAFFPFASLHCIV